jgi:hypothetical protein
MLIPHMVIGRLFTICKLHTFILLLLILPSYI